LVFNSNKISNSLSGASFVITGTLKGFTRDEAREFIISNGGTVQNEVSKNTMYLLVGEKPGSKKAKAEKLSVKIINEDELKEMAGTK
jgi:DNA ligase (NAD+)